MSYRLLSIMVVLTLLLFLGVNSPRAESIDDMDPASVMAADAGIYDYTTHGTAWTPQVRENFSVFKPLSVGTQTKVKIHGNQWVHIPMSFPTRIADSLAYIKYVEFCAQSTNGAFTKPIRMDLWDSDGRFLSADITWPADNLRHCIGQALEPPVWHTDLGVSVLLKFKNNTDAIILYKAFVRVTP